MWQKKTNVLLNLESIKYKLYLEVYDTIKDCVQQLRNKESLKGYEREF